MIEDQHEFELTLEEEQCLRRLASIDESLDKLIRISVGAKAKRTILLNREEAEHLRDSLTTRLAAVGFNADYSPNDQGQMIEDLIDRFHIT